MNQVEFGKKWERDKPIYCEWGKYVVAQITQQLINSGKNLDSFLKSPAKYRLKDDDSLIDKAFFRPDKNYENPYDDITDISNIIETTDIWSFNASKHFDDDKEKAPVADGETCKAILDSNASATSGIYYIDPDSGDNIPPFKAYCDMDTQGGGWTLVAIRVLVFIIYMA